MAYLFKLRSFTNVTTPPPPHFSKGKFQTNEKMYMNKSFLQNHNMCGIYTLVTVCLILYPSSLNFKLLDIKCFSLDYITMHFNN